MHNEADTKRVATGGWRRIAHHPAYRSTVRRLLPEAARRRLARAVLPPTPPPPPSPTAGDLAMLREVLDPEVQELARLLGTEPWWDLDATVARVGE